MGQREPRLLAAMALAVAASGCGNDESGKHECESERRAFPDGDGDGYGAGATVPFCLNLGAPPPDGYSWEGSDCNDDDALVFQLMYWDEDGDGVGAAVVGEPRPCVGGDTTGYSQLGDDCDDDDPAVNSRPEQWSDGIDDNCDGRYDPADCAADPEVCDCEAIAPRDVPVLAGCESLPDLFVLETTDYRRCEQWDNGGYLIVGNQGGADFSGAITLRLNGGGDVFEVSVERDVPSGSTGLPFALPDDPGEYDVQLDTGSIAECNLANNSAGILVPWPIETL
jgi:hypothetical protein